MIKKVGRYQGDIIDAQDYENELEVRKITLAANLQQCVLNHLKKKRFELEVR